MDAIELEGVVNFRDFGGMPGAGGRLLRRGLLFRSGHHAAATDRDLARLATLDFALIVDLRRPAERTRDPARRPPAARPVVLEHAGPADIAVAPHLAFLAEPNPALDQVTRQMIVGYRGYPFDPHYVTLYRAYFERLAGAEGPVLINCHAGKDRTGLLCALTLHVLGVAPEDIFADYLASNRHCRADARMGELAERFKALHGGEVSEALIRRLLMVDSTYLEAAFAAIDEVHGDLDAYLADALAVTSPVRKAIRARYLS
jgi:protein tyrosine/serine phosphatase